MKFCEINLMVLGIQVQVFLSRYFVFGPVSVFSKLFLSRKLIFGCCIGLLLGDLKSKTAVFAVLLKTFMMCSFRDISLNSTFYISAARVFQPNVWWFSWKTRVFRQPFSLLSFLWRFFSGFRFGWSYVCVDVIGESSWRGLFFKCYAVEAGLDYLQIFLLWICQ